MTNVHAEESQHLTITSQPDSICVEPNSNAVFSITVNEDEGVSYCWQVSKDDGITWKNVNANKYPSALTDTLTFVAIKSLHLYEYRCVVSKGDETVTSRLAQLRVEELAVWGQPKNVFIEDGFGWGFSALANHVNCSYTWQVSKDGGKTWKNVNATKYPASRKADFGFTVTKKMDGFKYRCKITEGSNTVYSNVVTLVVYNDEDLPGIKWDVESEIARSGDEVGFRAYSYGKNLSYAWQVSKDGGKTWKNVNVAKYPSAATWMLSFEANSALDGYQYRCKISNPNGTYVTNAATLTVEGGSIAIKSNPADQTVNSEDLTYFSVSAIGTDLSYQWQVSKDGGNTWKNVNSTKYPSSLTERLSFRASKSTDGFQYRCVISNTKESKISSVATLTVSGQ